MDNKPDFRTILHAKVQTILHEINIEAPFDVVVRETSELITTGHIVHARVDIKKPVTDEQADAIWLALQPLNQGTEKLSRIDFDNLNVGLCVVIEA